MSGYDIDVLMLDADGDPVRGARVKIYLDEGNALADFWKAGSLEEFTDDEGHAEFRTATEHRYVTIQCRGQEFGPHDVEDGSAFTVKLE